MPPHRAEEVPVEPQVVAPEAAGGVKVLADKETDHLVLRLVAPVQAPAGAEGAVEPVSVRHRVRGGHLRRVLLLRLVDARRMIAAASVRPAEAYPVGVLRKRVRAGALLRVQV